MKYKLGTFQTELIESRMDELRELVPERSFWVIDRTLIKLSTVFKSIDNEPFILEATEKTKNLHTAEKIFDWLQKKGANRESYVAAAGGGITTDITGWVCSNYMRGCHLINIPTTIIGMIDASIGGKTGINYHQSKNFLGSFYPAEKVVLVYELLDTLSEKEIRSGLGELLKMAFLPGNEIHERLINNGNDWLQDKEYLIRSAGAHKMRICQNDLRDKAERRTLNLGHTFAHVIESASEYRIEHGRAVAIGLIKAARLSYQMKMIGRARFAYICKLLESFFPASYLQIDEKTLSKIAETGEKYYNQDKKSRIILFSGENGIEIVRPVKWDKFKDVLLEDIN
jgi:3-dehydroquinate synthase